MPPGSEGPPVDSYSALPKSIPERHAYEFATEKLQEAKIVHPSKICHSPSHPLCDTDKPIFDLDHPYTS